MNKKLLINEKIKEASMFGFKIKEVDNRYYLTNTCNCCGHVYVEELDVVVYDETYVSLNLSVYCPICDVNSPQYEKEYELDLEDYTG